MAMSSFKKTYKSTIYKKIFWEMIHKTHQVIQGLPLLIIVNLLFISVIIWDKI